MPAQRFSNNANPKTRRLRETLLQLGYDDGQRTCVLVLGNGLHVQAAEGSKDDWRQTLRSMCRELGGDSRTIDSFGSPALQWASLIGLVSQGGRAERIRAEQELAQLLCKRLARLENRRGVERTLYSEILEANFANIVSFNIDRKLLRHLHASQILYPKTKRSFLYRKVRAKVKPDQFTDIWFPYGHAGDPESISFGYSTYDKRLLVLEDYRDEVMYRWFDWNAEYSEYELKSPRVAYRALRQNIKSWYDLFFLAPLVFIGVSLSPDDWPLWWLLHQRARNFVPFKEDECPRTFYLTCKGTNVDHLRGLPAGIELVEFSSFDSMWTFLRNALAQKGSRRY